MPDTGHAWRPDAWSIDVHSTCLSYYSDDHKSDKCKSAVEHVAMSNRYQMTTEINKTGVQHIWIAAKDTHLGAMVVETRRSV